MIRPALIHRARRWSEPAAALTATLFSLWLALLGGWFFAGLGLLTGLVALAWLLIALRRLPLRRGNSGPGLVEIDEGAIRYFGARVLGGELALRELTEIRLLRLNGRPHWRLKALGGQALLIPLDAAGAAALVDAFTALPGFEMGAVGGVLANTRGDGPKTRVIWSRSQT